MSVAGARVDEPGGGAVDARAFEEAAGPGARDRFFVFHAGDWEISDEPVSATRAMVPGDAVCKDACSELRGVGFAGTDQEDCGIAAGNRAGGRIDGLREVDDAGGDDRTH